MLYARNKLALKMGQESIRKLMKRSLQNYAICAKSERVHSQNKSKIINVFLEPFSDSDYGSQFNQPLSENLSQPAFQPYPTYSYSNPAPHFPDPSTLLDLTPYLTNLDASSSIPLASPFYPSISSSFGNLTPSPINLH